MIQKNPNKLFGQPNTNPAFRTYKSRERETVITKMTLTETHGMRGELFWGWRSSCHWHMEGWQETPEAVGVP